MSKLPARKGLKLPILGLFAGGLLGYVSCVAFLWVIHESESPMNQFDPNFANASIKALIVGAVIGFLAGILVAQRGLK